MKVELLFESNCRGHFIVKVFYVSSPNEKKNKLKWHFFAATTADDCVATSTKQKSEQQGGRY
jgi:hypothetical protein